LVCYDTLVKVRRINPDTIVLLKQIGIGLAVFTVLALLITAIWYGTRVESLTVKQIEVTGGQTIEHDRVRELVEQELVGEYLGLIPRRFAWLLPLSNIVEVVDELPRAYNVQTDRLDGQTLQVTFDEHIPFALWCDSVEQESNCYFLNEDGYSFSVAPRLSGGAFKRFVSLGKPAQADWQIMPKADFDRHNRLISLLAEQGWYVSHLEFDQVGDMFLKIVDGGELKVVAAEEPERVVENLLVVLSSSEFSDIAPGGFEYIDLRFGNKVFVNEETATSSVAALESTTASSSDE